jgi:hypothetical protein
LTQRPQPARDLAAPPVVQPRVGVHAVREIRERDEVLRAKVELAFRTAEIERTVFGQRTFAYLRT